MRDDIDTLVEKYNKINNENMEEIKMGSTTYTIEECIDAYVTRGTEFYINDGKIVGTTQD